MSVTNIRKLYSIYFCEWLLDAGEENILSLGIVFDERISDIIAFKATVAKEVSLISVEGLAFLVGNSSELMDDSTHTKNLQVDRKLRELAKSAPAEIAVSEKQDFALWALGLRPRVLADFNYWGKYDQFSIVELVWLSAGLAPRSASYEVKLFKKCRAHLFPLAEMERRRGLISRAFPMIQPGYIGGLEFHAWASQVEFIAHTGFHEMIKATASRIEKNLIGPTQTSPSKSLGREMQPREFRTAAKIITAMAVDVYGHVPNQKRSTTTKDIIDACDRAGLSVSNDTILRFLRAGEEQMDD